MIVKKLRNKHNWSQERLAELCGLNVRTIQRVENGNKASVETLMSLSSVFEVDISKLTKEITVIDKKAENWQKAPWWASMGVWCIKTRRTAIILEMLCVFIGCIGYVAFFFYPHKLTVLTAAWGSAYWYAISIRWIDKENLW